MTIQITFSEVATKPLNHNIIRYLPTLGKRSAPAQKR